MRRCLGVGRGEGDSVGLATTSQVEKMNGVSLDLGTRVLADAARHKTTLQMLYLPGA